MTNKISDLYYEIKEKITPSRLKEISIDIINKFKNKDHEYFFQFAKMIGIDSFNKNINRIFGKIIQIYHPDKLNIIINELESLYNDKKYEELLRLKNIYLIDIKSIRTGVGYAYIGNDDYAYTEDDFGYAEYEFTDQDIFYDQESDYSYFEDDTVFQEHGFIEAINKLFFGNLDFTITVPDLINIEGELDLSDFEINDLTGIENCINLTVLNLSGNNIIKIRQLSAISKLKALFISENNIEDISCLNSLSDLMELDISFNNIEDISVLLELPRLSYVNVIHNPLTDNSIIEKLIGKGAIVIY